MLVSISAMVSRRTLLGYAAIAPLGFLAARTAHAADAAACYDPSALPLSQRNRRRSLAYLEVSGDTKKTCALCAFFTARPQSNCGTCQLLTGGPVQSGAVCNSFAVKAR